MKTLKDIENAVKKMGFIPSIQKTELGDVVFLELSIKERTQKCIAKVGKHEQQGDIVEVVSFVGELNRTDPAKVVETLMALCMLNQHLITAKTQIDQKGEKMYIVARTLAPSCSDKELEAMIKEVAIFADVLEQQLIGIDEA